MIDLRSPEFIVMNERNLWEFSLCIGRARQGQIYDTPELKWTYAGGPAFNRVFAARLPDGSAIESIADVTSRFITWKAPAVWITGPSTCPGNLGRMLESCGWQHRADWACMAADPKAMPAAPAPIEGLSIIEVLDEAALADFGKAACLGFAFNPSIHAAACRHVSELGIGPDKPWRHFLARLDGAPVGTCTLFSGSETAGLYLISTVPEARRRGIAKAITWYAMNEARLVNHPLIVLQASDMGAHVYPKLGFVEHCLMSLHVLNP